MMSKSNLFGSSAPHVFARHTSSSIMREVLFALVPILIFATVFFGYRVLLITTISVVSSVLWEYLWQKMMHKKVSVFDCSAAVTGMLLAFNLPVNIPLWIPLIGSAVAILLVKQMFGGIGRNYLNPALAGRFVLLIFFSDAMTSFSVDGVAVATPLALLKEGLIQEVPSYMSCFLGVIPGTIGETSKLLILLGGFYLMFKRIIDFRIPVAFIGSVFLFSYLFGGDGLYHILTGGIMLAAFFMATDYTTSPTYKAGKWIFGIGCGLITTLIRFYSSFPEGVTFSILLMNLCVPLIDRFTRRRAFGESKKSILKKNLQSN